MSINVFQAILIGLWTAFCFSGMLLGIYTNRCTQIIHTSLN